MIERDDIDAAWLRRISRTEYDRMVALGIFGADKLELLGGVLASMSPQGSPHAATVSRLAYWLMGALGTRALVRVQSSFAATDDSQPEPDLAVVPYRSDHYASAHPDHALLIVEVADESLRKDRRKARIYAAARVPEYWIVDLPGQSVEVMTDRRDDDYQLTPVLRRGDQLSPRAFADLSLSVAELLG